jgi:hypothetical protein
MTEGVIARSLKTQWSAGVEAILGIFKVNILR